MHGDFENEYDVLFENNATSSYLVLRIKDGGNVLDYQVQMLLNNNISGLLVFNTNCIGSQVNYFYNVTSKYTLINFMSRKKFSRNEFLMMLLNIINNICHIKNYLLYASNILLDERYIYVDPEKMEVYFAYLPFKAYKCDYKTFLLKLIIEMSNFNREDCDNFLQRILEVIKSELFSLNMLKTQLEMLLGNCIENQPQSLEILTEDNSEHENDKRSGQKAVKKLNHKTDINIGNKIKKAHTINKVKIPLPRCDNNFDNRRTAEAEDNNLGKLLSPGNNKLAGIGILLLQPLLAVVFTLTMKSGLTDYGGNRAVSAIITLIIFICIDALVIRLIGARYKDLTNRNISGAINTITEKMRAGASLPKDKAAKSIIIGQESIREKNSNTQNSYNGETEIIRRAGIKARAYLKEIEGDMLIELDKKSILVGRMDAFVDTVINCSAVGKIHAEILYEEGGFYIVDCNSKNGTFVNEKRLVPNLKNKVMNNDLIRFANKEFKLFTTSDPRGGAA